MKKFFWLSIILFGFSIPTNAQDISQASKNVKNIAHVNAEKWHNTLVLTDNQVKKLIDFNILYELKKNTIFKSDSDMEEKNTQLKVIEQEHFSKVETILNDTQKTLFHKKIAEVKG